MSVVDVERGGVRRVLRGGRRPQRPLHPRALRRERVPPRAGERREEELVRELGVGDRGRPAQRVALGEPAVGLGVDPAHEERRDRREVARCRRRARRGCSSPSRNALDDLRVALETEDQRDVDVDTRARAWP